MRVLVTGATGFVGRAVLAALRERGHELRALSRQPVELPGTRVITGDLLSPAAIAEAVSGVDAVCHLAAATRVRESAASPIQYWQTNVSGTLGLLAALAAEEGPKRLVLASTAAVYGVSERQPIDEETPARPTGPYGRSKLAADQATADAAAAGIIGAVSLRSFNVCGDADGAADPDRSRLVPKILAVQAGLAPELAVNGDGSAVRDFVHARDMAQAFALALDACRPGRWRAYNVGSGRRTSVADMIRAAERVTGRAVPLRHQPPADEPPVLLADNTRICREFGWQPHNSNPTRILTDGWKALNSGYSATE